MVNPRIVNPPPVTVMVFTLGSPLMVAVFSSHSADLVRGDTNGVVDVFRRNLAVGATRRVSVSSSGTQGDADSSFSRDLAVSADGRHVAFGSFAANLVAGDTNDNPDTFVWDRGCAGRP